MSDQPQDPQAGEYDFSKTPLENYEFACRNDFNQRRTIADSRAHYDDICVELETMRKAFAAYYRDLNDGWYISDAEVDSVIAAWVESVEEK